MYDYDKKYLEKISFTAFITIKLSRLEANECFGGFRRIVLCVVGVKFFDLNTTETDSFQRQLRCHFDAISLKTVSLQPETGVNMSEAIGLSEKY